MTSFNGCYIIIKNVPCKKCTQCGEEYLNGVTMKKIETIISRLKDLLTEVAIVDYNHAAWLLQKGSVHMPLLKNDQYTSEDYWNLPEGTRAELIDGKLYDMAPPSRIHQEISYQLSRVIGNYIAEKGGNCKV